MRPSRTLQLFAFLFLPISVWGQNALKKLEIVGGISAREYVHGGLRYQYSDNAQFGLYYGSDVGLYKSVITTYSANNMLHFGRESQHLNHRIWYARQGFTLIKSIEPDRKVNTSNIDLALGRDFPLTNWLGINADMGLLWQVREKHKLNSGGDYFYNSGWYWMPLFRVQMYISL